MEPKGNLTLRQILLNTAWTIPVVVVVEDTTSKVKACLEMVRKGPFWELPWKY